jgi:Holliday junction resolvase RusA-like endonuclease
VVTITVYGVPAPQGSKKFVGVHAGRGVMVESSKKVKPWRVAVKAAFEAWIAYRRSLRAFEVMDGPLALQIVFTLPAPKSLPKRTASHPSKTPDLSKLIRSTEDAITNAGLWADDARVIEVRARKTYPKDIIGSHIDALNRPGAVITIESAVIR